ncbi:hypothetical protein JTE90_009187 [Oedothorax gibbosus]|uniref:FK506-binding protein n=1 Tax=Oedothorax gibbosus TaxID=931172 RepID=A0AAV6UZ84_9ARAC|nr:hypothetical protein JTE90_009187 [Oedothorax gibbosus]
MQNLQIEKASDSKTEFWGICCETGKRYSQIVGKKFHISMAALDPTDTSTSAVVSLMAEHDGCQYLLCSLKKDSILQVLLNLYFDKGENITFFLKGHGTVHLSGYYVCDSADNVKNLKNIKKAALNKSANKGGKADFTVSANVESSDEEASDEISPAKASPSAAKGVLNTKAKLPKAIANEEESSEDDSIEDDIPKQKEESEEEDEVPTMKRGHSAVESSDEESDEDSDESEDSKELKAGINYIKKQLQQKKLKSGASTPVQNNKGGKKSITNNGEPDLNSSIGRTPMPKKVKSQSNLPLDEFLAEIKQESKSPKKDSSKSEEANTSATKTPEKSSNDLNTSAQSESGKKKKNKKKAKQASENQNTPNKTPSKQQFSNKLAGGIEYEDIRPGNGLVAKKGKLVHVYYTGQLENNKVFDSVQQGQKPFSFKLASGQVIKGWDLGIEGMKVGGKRRLKVPPHMGYGNKRTGPIPPNSNLYFTVELKAIS